MTSRNSSKSARGSRSNTKGSSWRVGLVLWEAARAWRLAVRDELAPLRLTPSQFVVLDAVARLGPNFSDGTTQQMVVDNVGMDRTTVSQIMQTLEKRGLVDRGDERRTVAPQTCGAGRATRERGQSGAARHRKGIRQGAAAGGGFPQG